MTWPDDFEELAEELRRRVGAEFTQEAAEVEHLTELQRRRRAVLADAARIAMNRGDRVTVACAGGTWVGEVAAVGDDYAIVETAELAVEVRLDGVWWGSQPSREGGRAVRPASATWRARLGELAEIGEPLELLAPALGLAAKGKIEVVATDHLVVATEIGDRLYIPLVELTVVVRPRPR